MRILTAERVNEILRDSLYRDEELTREDAIRVKGIVQTERLKAYQEEIKNLIACLPDAFVSGGGWTFLNLCTDKDGNLWGQHNNCEELYCLAAGLGMAGFCMPRDMWSVLPGGVPYIEGPVATRNKGSLFLVQEDNPNTGGLKC